MYGKITRAIAALATLSLITACASEAELQQRRDNAYDISGRYKVDMGTGSEVAMDMHIVNESGRHDIMITMDRGTDFSAKERNLLTRNGISNPDRVLQAFNGPLVFGQGYTSGLDGGENISDDFGETSRFNVCTPTRTFNHDYKTDHSYLVYYCLNGTFKKSTNTLKGDLTMKVNHHYTKYQDGEMVHTFDFDSASLYYQTYVADNFYNQYIGDWNGKIDAIDGDFSESWLNDISIQEDWNSNTFTVRPVLHERITFENDTYIYNPGASTKDIYVLKQTKKPIIEMVFDGPANQKIMILGEIKSLGNLSGSIYYSRDGAKSEIAVFKYRKL